jgi:diguanylate cyclase (GGDEF)-like protein
MPSLVDLCVIGDARSWRSRLVDNLRAEGYSALEADDLLAGIECVRRHQPRVALCDWTVAGRSGLDICRMLRADPLTSTCYIILMAHRSSSQVCSEGLTAGADDVVNRNRRFDDLLSRIRVGQRMWDLQMDLKQAAVTDGLTGLYNHMHFAHVLESEFARSRRYGTGLSMILIDIDHFKAVNDTFGHQAGDLVLQQVGRVLRTAVREVDLVARYGGEEFAVIAPQANLAQAGELAERLRRQIVDRVKPEEIHEHPVTASFGVASDEDSRVATASDLVEMSDQALYAAKRAGRNRVVTALEASRIGQVDTWDYAEVDHLRKQVATLSAQAKEAYVQSIWALVQALEARDRYTARHSQNVTFFAEQLALRLGLSPAMMRSVRLAAMLHDIGKVGVPDSVLMKPGSLTQAERVILRNVPQLSASIVDHMRILQTELPIIRHQRENFDGSGYPLGLRGEQIPVGARILMVADAFDSLTTDRIFRGHRSIPDALAEIRLHTGTQFDPRVVEALEACVLKDKARWIECVESSHSLPQPAEAVVTGGPE